MIPPEKKKGRAVSARPIRPQSGTARRSQKTQFIESLYGGTVVNRKGFSQHYTVKQDQQKYKKLLPTKATKDYEQYFQQNMHLKATINKLNEQISLQRGHIQTLEKKNHKYSKQTKMEFQKQLYWTGSNAHMITGIKSHYDTLKARYDEKCKECEDLKRDKKYSQVAEYRIYSQNLQKQNTRLQLKLQALMYQEQALPKNSKQISEYLLKQLQLKNHKLSQKVHDLQSLLKIANTNITDLNKKIHFLQKLIIEKDNAQYHASRKAKKVQKEKLAVQVELEQVKNEKKALQDQYETKITNLKTKQQRKYSIEKSMFQKTLNQQDQKIQKLEKQVAYLSTLLTYWKPLDEINREVADKIMSQEKNNSDKNMLASSVKEPLISQRKMSITVTNRKASANHEQLNLNANLANIFDNLSKPKEKRMPHSASERHSEEAQKKRKVSKDQVQQIGQLLKYRFIAQNISMEEVKEAFTIHKNKSERHASQNDQHQFASEEQQDEDSDENWKVKYITMKQVIDILKSPMFNLNDDYAFLLSRYMIQDSQNQFVYCDMNNQNLRSILKSIIKAIVGQYETLSETERQEVDKQCATILKMYESNLVPALKTVASSGFVTHKKFLELVYSLGIELSDKAKDQLVAKMSMESESLNKLSYKILW